MSNLQRIYQLHRILAPRTQPVSHQTLQELLECSRATVNRAIESLRLYFNAPLVYDRERNGYYYESRDTGPFELPGVWFDAHELYALLAVQQLLEQIQPGLLGTQLQTVKDRLEKILTSQHPDNRQITSRIRILRMMGRHTAPRHFQSAASALLQHKQLDIICHSRSHDRQTALNSRSAVCVALTIRTREIRINRWSNLVIMYCIPSLGFA